MPAKKPVTLAQAQQLVDGSFIPEPMERRALEVLGEAMEATTYVRASKPGGGIQYTSVPDHPIRVAAAVRLLEWRRGKPAAQITVSDTSGGKQAKLTTQDLVRILAENPELADKVIDACVDEAKKVYPADEQADTSKLPPPPPESESGASPR